MKRTRHKCHTCDKYFYDEKKRDEHELLNRHEHWLWKTRKVNYWTKTKKGEITFQRVSLSVVWVLRNGKYLFSIEADSLKRAIEDVAKI